MLTDREIPVCVSVSVRVALDWKRKAVAISACCLFFCFARGPRGRTRKQRESNLLLQEFTQLQAKSSKSSETDGPRRASLATTRLLAPALSVRAWVAPSGETAKTLMTASTISQFEGITRASHLVTFTAFVTHSTVTHLEAPHLRPLSDDNRLGRRLGLPATAALSFLLEKSTTTKRVIYWTCS